MIFDPNNVQVRLHPSPLLAGAMAWEAVVSVARHASADFVCQPGSGEGGLGHTLASWLADAGPQVALQWCMGGLWKPGDVGAMLSIAVVGSSPDQAQRRVLERARELAMWMDIHGEGEDWEPVCPSRARPQGGPSPWYAQPIAVELEPPLFRQGCAICRTPEGATERFLEVGRRTQSGLLWTLRSRPMGVEADRLVARWLEVRPPPRRGLIREAPPQRIRRLESLPEAQPYEVAVAIVRREPVDDLVRFAAREAILELGTRECRPGAAVELPADLGVHGAFDFCNGATLQGLDRVTAKHLLRWIPGVAAAEDDGAYASTSAELCASRMGHAHRH